MMLFWSAGLLLVDGLGFSAFWATVAVPFAAVMAA
jgi:hypothetical protein